MSDRRPRRDCDPAPVVLDVVRPGSRPPGVPIAVETRANPLDLEAAIRTLVNRALTTAGLPDDQRRAVDVRTYLADGGQVLTVQFVAPIDHEQAARIVEAATHSG